MAGRDKHPTLSDARSHPSTDHYTTRGKVKLSFQSDAAVQAYLVKHGLADKCCPARCRFCNQYHMVTAK